MAITFVTTAVAGAYVNREQPYALHGPWLQILIPDEQLDSILSELENIDYLDKVTEKNPCEIFFLLL